ncbi:MAG: methyltransferase domain-containing protein [Deltaproteobacteria bacterium]|nr:methyltransferase domain-containing protein [Deltaproteobacteria bacterium]
MQRFPESFGQMLRGFQQSRVLLTAIELDIFTAVGDGADARTVAGRADTDVRATESLLNALVALGLLSKSSGQYSNLETARLFLVAGSPADARLALMHNVDMWRSWSSLTDCVRAGTAVGWRSVEERDDRWTEAFIAAMHHNAATRAEQVAEAIDLHGPARILDVGGGSGAYSIAFCRRDPTIEAEILDLPTVVPIATRHVSEAGLSDRIHLRAGDMLTDSFGKGFDLVILSAICHMLSHEDNVRLLAKAHDALASGGRVVIQDFILSDDKTQPVAAALFALNMLVATKQGSAYSEAEYRDWLDQAGFRAGERIALPGPTDLVVGQR